MTKKSLGSNSVSSQFLIVHRILFEYLISIVIQIQEEEK